MKLPHYRKIQISQAQAFGISTLAIAFLVSMSICVSPAKSKESAIQDDDGKNFFSDPGYSRPGASSLKIGGASSKQSGASSSPVGATSKLNGESLTRGNATSGAESEQKLPKYRVETKPADKIRLYIQAGTPELEQVRLIGSLKGKQREEIVKIFEKGRAELQPMMLEFNEARKKMPAALIDKMLSQDEPVMDMMTKAEDFEQLTKTRSILQNLRSKKLSIWEEAQAKLSPTQLDELDKLKSGEVPADYATDAK